MLFVYTRHRPPCPFHDVRYRRCHCPKWIRGPLENRGLIRISAHTRSWIKAERKLRVMEREAEQNLITIEDAVAAYLEDETGRKLRPATVKQKSAFLRGLLLAWSKQQQLLYLNELQIPQLRQFRQSWNVAANTAGRWHERLRSFFAFCVSGGWLHTNPTDALKRPVRHRVPPTDYFNRQEFQQIVLATKKYEYGGGRDCRHRARRMLALVSLMRWSGLAIMDAVTLPRHRLDERGALFLRRAKTGTPVFVPLPPAVASLLRSLPSVNPAYFFWSGNGNPRSAVQDYHRSFRKLFRLADIRNQDGSRKPCRSHMFRDTFAVELLLAGVPIDQVSILLGHHSVKMTEKHYLPWVQARQRQLTASVRRAWFPELRKAPAPGAGRLSEAESYTSFSRH